MRALIVKRVKMSIGILRNDKILMLILSHHQITVDKLIFTCRVGNVSVN